jgi:Niemann-Pick C1 protein
MNLLYLIVIIYLYKGSSLVMDIFCGKWKSVGCNPKRWFDFVGKASSGVVSFDLKINLVPRTIMMAKNSTIMIDLAQKGMTPFTFNATNCETAPPGETACECVDCDASCPYIPPPKQHITTSFLTSDGMLLLMGMIAGIGCVTIFVVTIVLFIRRQKAKKTSFSFVQGIYSCSFQ